MTINYLYAFRSITYYQNTLILHQKKKKKNLEGKKFKRNGHFEEIKHGI